ncbi:MAG: 1-deoxy-D-xylulose-5-phosphate reductoisomerase [Devosiaceae bacterium]|nr:1-deoxy-D-xylulose-5-phosphate reductoisomerase [Devosiaceae bacterium MH13]
MTAVPRDSASPVGSGDAAAPKSLCLLGATGSIGDSAADIALDNPQAFQVVTVVANTNAPKLAARARELGARHAVVADLASLGALKEALSGTGITAAAGAEAVVDAAQRPCDIVVSAMVGAAGMHPTMAAIEAGRTVALANKEALVCAGALMMERARAHGTTLLPLDSEHNALFQVFEAANRGAIEKVTLTASGGPFRTWSKGQIANASLQDALNHPNWSMGRKVTIDSASLANKGLEVIEAHHLFDLPADQIDVVVHPQSIIHGMVHYTDGSVLAQLGMPDMRTPIAAALAWPDRCSAPRVERLELADLGRMTFEPPDHERFPMLGLAFESLRLGGLYPALFNAANEVAVSALLDGRIAFHQIATIVEMTFDLAAKTEPATFATPGSLADVVAADAVGRGFANRMLANALQRDVRVS